MKRIVYTVLLAITATFSYAQVKVGANPGTITPGAVLDIEGSTTTTRTVSLTNGNLGIGTTTPNAPLQFANTPLTARKIVLYEGGNNDNQFFGFGVQPGMLRYQTSNSGNDDHVFMTGVSSTTSTELMRIKGTGNVGIGVSSPNSKLHVQDNANNLISVNVVNSNAGTGAQTGLRILNDAGSAAFFINSSKNTSDGGVNTATLRNESGSLRLQSSGAKGMTIASGDVTTDGSVTIKNIPSLGGTVMLTADNDGTIRKQALPVASAPVIFSTRPAGAPNGVDITASSPGPNNYVWTGLQIVIPANSVYIVSSTQLLNSQQNRSYNQGAHFWVRSRLSTSSTQLVNPVSGIIQGSYLISGSLDGPLGLLNGQIRVSNTGSDPLTLYYFVGDTIDTGATLSGTTSTPFSGTIPGVGSSTWQENQLFAIPTN